MIDADDLALLTGTLRKTMTTASGRALDTALTELGWPELLADYPETAIPLVFRLLGETGAHAPILADVVAREAGKPLPAEVVLPFARGGWVRWDRGDGPGDTLDEELPLHRVPAGEPIPLADGRRALGWWLLGTGHAMLALARRHALDRNQFGHPIAGFQAVRHRLAETLVALDGAEAALRTSPGELGALLAKAAAGQAALTASRHCGQVLGGLGFTAEHALYRHLRRSLVLDGLLGSTKELTREAGALIRRAGCAPRLAQLD